MPSMSQKPVSTPPAPIRGFRRCRQRGPEAAVAKAAELGVKINVACRQRRQPRRLPAHAGCFVQSIDIAIDKAYTAAGFGFSTKDWMKLDRSR